MKSIHVYDKNLNNGERYKVKSQSLQTPSSTPHLEHFFLYHPRNSYPYFKYKLQFYTFLYLMYLEVLQIRTSRSTSFFFMLYIFFIV